jgi:hypothetical protein
MNILQHIVVICALVVVAGLTNSLSTCCDRSEPVIHYCYKLGATIFWTGFLGWVSYTFYQLFVLAGTIGG